MSSIPMPASPSARTTSTSCRAPPSAEMVQTLRSLVERRASRPAASTSAASGETCALVHDHLDALAADLSLELVRGAVGR